MGLVNWLKTLADKDADDRGPAKPPRAAQATRRPRKGGEAYAKEWVKVLEESAPNHDPFDTYSWELHETDSRDDPWGLKQDAPKPPPKRATGVNPYDTGVFDASWTGKFDKR